MRTAIPSCGRRSEAAFTMAEIAIALGVIAFALIAIIGILPSGLQGQRDNREDTIIHQDARVLLEAIRTGGRDATSDIASYVEQIDGNPPPGGFTTADAVRLLSDNTVSHQITFRAISGAIASRGSELGFRYLVVNSVTNASDNFLFGAADDFAGTVLSNQVHELRLRFFWPVKANGTVGLEANRYLARTLISGWHTNGVVYAQEYHQPAP